MKILLKFEVAVDGAHAEVDEIGPKVAMALDVRTRDRNGWRLSGLRHDVIIKSVHYVPETNVA